MFLASSVGLNKSRNRRGKADREIIVVAQGNRGHRHNNPAPDSLSEGKLMDERINRRKWY